MSRTGTSARDPAAPFPQASPPPDALRQRLGRLAEQYERPAFIGEDPISIPHAFDDPADREVAGLFAAILAWGRRSVLLAKLAELMDRMHYTPAAFVRSFDPARHADRLDGFKHRTFTSGDAVSLTLALQAALTRYGSLEALAVAHLPPEAPHVGPAIQGLSETLLTIVPDTPTRLKKHLARPSTGSACKRLAMYMRWMVRPGPVDFGLWRGISPSQLLLPLDVHTGRQARRLGLLERSYDDWRATLALTAACRAMAPDDPARYDYALFGLGAYDGEPMPEA
ncbi:MAG: TIGR02757 family protein [Bacteroidota bacterium]